MTMVFAEVAAPADGGGTAVGAGQQADADQAPQRRGVRHGDAACLQWLRVCDPVASCHKGPGQKLVIHCICPSGSGGDHFGRAELLSCVRDAPSLDAGLGPRAWRGLSQPQIAQGPARSRPPGGWWVGAAGRSGEPVEPTRLAYRFAAIYARRASHAGSQPRENRETGVEGSRGVQKNSCPTRRAEAHPALCARHRRVSTPSGTRRARARRTTRSPATRLRRRRRSRQTTARLTTAPLVTQPCMPTPTCPRPAARCPRCLRAKATWAAPPAVPAARAARRTSSGASRLLTSHPWTGHAHVRPRRGHPRARPRRHARHGHCHPRHACPRPASNRLA